MLLVSASLLHLPDYHCDNILYLVATDSVVLVQDDDDGTEHVVYYLSRDLLDTETRYASVKNLALAVVHVVQCFHHYILLCTMKVISNYNSMI